MSDVIDSLRSLLAEPAIPDPPRRVWRDWVLVGALMAALVLEVSLRPDMAYRWAGLAVGPFLLLTLLWRRTHPLLTVGIAFGSFILADIAIVIAGGQPIEHYSPAALLILPYALFRWASGRDAAIGFVLIVTLFVWANVVDYTGIGETIGGGIIMLFPVVLAQWIRYQTGYRQRTVEQAKALQREQIARELHDTVGHYVSVIAVRAQAGKAVAATRPEAAIEALDIIEEAASRTLAEMRQIVTMLRQDGDAPNLTPQPGIGDIERLAQSVAHGPAVDVHLTGELRNVAPSVGTALYRLTQESITNAARHARHATRINVTVEGNGDHVHLTVADDGDPSPPAVSSAGFGLQGMAERARLLGGTLEAGPSPGRGWTVSAALPRDPAKA